MKNFLVTMDQKKKIQKLNRSIDTTNEIFNKI